MIWRSPRSKLFPYTTLFRSLEIQRRLALIAEHLEDRRPALFGDFHTPILEMDDVHLQRSEEHTSELQSHSDLVCRLLLEKKHIKILVIHIQVTLKRMLSASL